jgi:hypothetical protein
MKRSITALALISFACAIAGAQTLAPNTAVVLVNGASLSEETNKVLKAIDYLTLGDIVMLIGRTAAYADAGTQRDFTRVKAPNGKEGWVRTQYIASKASLAIVKADQAAIYTEPRTVKLTSKYINAMVLVAVLQDGSSSTYAKVQGFDSAQNSLFTDSTYVRTDDLTTLAADVSAAILYNVSKATKDAAVKKNLLRVARLKYGSSMFTPKIDEALAVLP